MKHDFQIKPGSFMTLVFVCFQCPDPEPDTVSYIWRDSDGAVYFDGISVNELLAFIVQHDGLKIMEVEGV